MFQAWQRLNVVGIHAMAHLAGVMQLTALGNLTELLSVVAEVGGTRATITETDL